MDLLNSEVIKNEVTKYVYQAKLLIEEYLMNKHIDKKHLLHQALSILEKSGESLSKNDCSM